MKRYFFHISSKDGVISDAKGCELGDLASAHRHAMLLIYKMVLLDDLDWRGWSVKVSDSSGRSALSVLFPQLPYKPARRHRVGFELKAE